MTAAEAGAAATAPAGGAPAGVDETPPAAAPDQRTRILSTALTLMSERGAHTMSMRQLAGACDLNVATLYHYFPSKAELLRAVLEDKHYLERLEATAPSVDASAPPRERLAGLVASFLQGVVDEESTWRLILGEALRGEAVALDAVTELSAAIGATLEDWLDAHFPELTVAPGLAARAVRDQVLAFCVEHLTLDADERARRLEERAGDLAALVFPGR